MPLTPVSTTPVPATQVSADPSQSTQQLAPPGKKWVLMEGMAPASVPPATIQPPTPKPETADITTDLKATQAAVNRMQLIIEAAWSCLLEQRLNYPIVKVGILEAYLPQRKIEVLTNCRDPRIHYNSWAGIPMGCRPQEKNDCWVDADSSNLIQKECSTTSVTYQS